MNATGSRWTPILAPSGCQQVAMPGIATALPDLVTIPADAYFALVQGLGGTITFSLDGSTAPGAALTATEVRLTNPAAIRRFVVKAGTATQLVVQFYTGTSGL